MEREYGVFSSCRKCRINMEKMWEEFERLFPEIKGENSDAFYGAGFPQVPTLECYPSGRVIICTWWQAKYILNRRRSWDLYVWYQKAPGSTGPWQRHAIGYQEADSMMVQMPDGSWNRLDL